MFVRTLHSSVGTIPSVQGPIYCDFVFVSQAYWMPLQCSLHDTCRRGTHLCSEVCPLRSAVLGAAALFFCR